MGAVKERVQEVLDRIEEAEFKTTGWLKAVAELRWFSAAPYDKANGMIRVRGHQVLGTTSKPSKGPNIYVTLKSEGVKKHDVASPTWMNNSAVAVPSE